MTADILAKAQQHFGRGENQAGLTLLGQAARAHDPSALEMLGQMALSGDIVNRDLPLSRNLFRQAAAAGSTTAAATYRAFVANGTGAPPDWAKAVDLLRQAAPSDPDARRELDLIESMSLNPDGSPAGEFAQTRLSESPNARSFPALFTPDECDFLVERASPALAPSVVVDPSTHQQVPNPVRTSHSTAFPLMLESPAIHALNRRLAAASETDVRQGEPLQVLRYRPSQQYRAHFDAIEGADNQRVLTFLVYLNEGFEGGETQFLATGLKFAGRKGDGLLFRNADAAGRLDERSRHAGLPVTAGEKYLASRWIRERPFGPNG